MRVPFRSLPAACAAALLAGAAAAQSPIPAPETSPDRGWTVPALPAPAPIAAAEYAARRRALAAQMEDGVLVAVGRDESGPSYQAFAQTSNFRYLTGFTEPGAVLVIAKRGGKVVEQLFVPPRDPSREVWDGARLGAEGATRATGIPSRNVDEFQAALPALLRGTPTLYALVPEGGTFLNTEQQLLEMLREEYPGLTRQVDLRGQVTALRQTKTPAELDLLRRAIFITTLAHREAARAVEPGMNEFEIHALIEATFRRYGAERPGFGSIVGSGPNSTTLHYRAADRFMQPGEMLVMDIGAAYGGYTADVTRTVPVNGRFNPEQRAVYEIVLAAQKAAEQAVRPGVTMAALGDVAAGVLSEGLARLGLIESPTATYDCEMNGQRGECPQYTLFYMHGVGHGIGLDVHDPDAGYSTGFVLGSAFTIEPGIYVRGDVLDYLPDTPRNRAMAERIRPAVARYRDIGVRIEDDYFVTAAGVERVSAGAPREIAEIEALMALDSLWNRERRPEVVEWYRGASPR